ncbi:MAG TPA: flagellar export chaperone FliS [Fimbriimonadaceae bacterium]|nr:flagellar export chaperone FliS [Fimbriimonadaceae bacterium]
MAYSSIDQYRKSSVSSASPLQLVVLLYDGALRFMEAGKHAMIQRDVYRQNESLTKAQRIVCELLSTLDLDKGGEIAQNLASLYTYVYNRLVQANIEDKPELVDEAMAVMSELRESWVELERESRKGAEDAA